MLKLNVLQLLYHICLKVVESVLHFQYYLLFIPNIRFNVSGIRESSENLAVGCIYFQKEIECPILLSMF